MLAEVAERVVAGNSRVAAIAAVTVDCQGGQVPSAGLDAEVINLSRRISDKIHNQR